MAPRPTPTTSLDDADGGETTMTLQLVYTVQEAAEVLRIGNSTARERIRSGELRSFKDGTRRLVLGEDLMAYVRARREATHA
ncbi:MAG: helix-turn-helix domain-containing protein [Actinomycetota bacterium]